MKKHIFNNQGLSVLEIVLAAAIFIIFATGAVVGMIQAYNANRLGLEFTVASQYASEGLEAVRSIKNQSYTNITNTSQTGVTRGVGGTWSFSGTNNTFTSGKQYTRTIKIEDVRRDAAPPLGNIVSSGGTLDSDSKKITSTVTWNFTAKRPESINFVTYLSDWRKTISRGGLLVFADGNGTTDAIKYRVLNNNGTWGTLTALPDFDTSATNKVLRVLRMYASSTRNEKIVISRHFNGTQESIWAHIYNGTTWSSGQLAAWTGSTFDTANQGIKNFDSAYLNNGNFIVVYSDNSNTPKYRTWNGNAWNPVLTSAGSSTTNMGGIPTNVTLKARPSTNEAMLTTFDQSSDTNTTYFNGSSWSSATEHATGAPTNTKEFAEFGWSANDSTKGALIYQTASNDRGMNLKIWTANGSGGGSWSSTVNTSNQGTLGAMELDGGRIGATEFMACDKDANNDIYCYRGNTNPSWSNPTNQRMTATSDTGIQRSFDVGYESSGTDALVVYADTSSPSTQARVKSYDATTNGFDSTATTINAASGTVKTVKLRANPISDDIMIMVGDVNNDLYTVLWNGTSNTITSSTFTTQGTQGTATTDYWYGFAWDGL